MNKKLRLERKVKDMKVKAGRYKSASVAASFGGHSAAAAVKEQSCVLFSTVALLLWHFYYCFVKNIC